jgi:NTE family protein
MLLNHMRVGLALGGGVVRGVSHIGVLSALQEAQIPIDYVAGTSAGSLVGALYCAGWSIERIRAAAKDLRWWRLARLTWPKFGWLSFEPMSRWLISQLGDIQIRDLHIPFAAVATNLVTGEPIRFCEGRLAPIIQASCSVPGLVAPTLIDELMLGDGSLSDTVPVSILREMGAEYVIGVDIFSPVYRRRLGPFSMALTSLEILVQHAGGGVELADCIIRPQLSGKTYSQFSKTEELIALGQQAVQRKLVEICQDLSIP